jgi:polysaccharide biosynthesis transport protein
MRRLDMRKLLPLCAALLVLPFGADRVVGAPTSDTARAVPVADDATKFGPLTDQQIAELNSLLVQARVVTAEAKARLDRLTDLLDRNKPFDPAESSFAMLADTLNDPEIDKLRQQYLEYAAREAEYSRRYGATHLAVVNLRNQMNEIRKSIVDELDHIVEIYRSSYEVAKAREAAIEKSLTEAVRTAR